MYRVVLTKRAVKGLDRAPDNVRRKATEAIEALQQSFAPARLFDVKAERHERHFPNKIGRLAINLRV